MKLKTTGLHDNGSSLLLLVAPSEELLAEQARIVQTVPGQTPVDCLHITLMRSPRSDQRLPLPPPPACIDLESACRLVSQHDKTSVYLQVTPASQHELAAYVAKIERDIGSSGFSNPARVFHVSLSNLHGAYRQSVGKVWEVPSTPL